MNVLDKLIKRMVDAGYSNAYIESFVWASRDKNISMDDITKTINFYRIDLLEEFEKWYVGDPRQTEKICEAMARMHNLDAEQVKEFIYLNRWKD